MLGPGEISIDTHIPVILLFTSGVPVVQYPIAIVIKPKHFELDL